MLGESVPAPIHGPPFLLRESSSEGSVQAAVPSENPTCSGVVLHGLLLLHCGLLQKIRGFQRNFPSFSKFGIHRFVSQTDFAVKLVGSSLVQHESLWSLLTYTLKIPATKSMLGNISVLKGVGEKDFLN